MPLVRVVVFLLGLGLASLTVVSAVKTFVLPRAARDSLAHFVYAATRSLFGLLLAGSRSYERRDGMMAVYGPVSLLALLLAWLTLLIAGYGAMFWATGAPTIDKSIREAGSSLLTLGFESPPTMIHTVLAFSAATTGLLLVTLLIAYLPTVYAAFSRRETMVKLLEVRAGNPPSAVEMLLRFYRIHNLDELGRQWESWEAWFADIDESHTSLTPLVFFRSPLPQHCWVTAAGAVLDAAALMRSSLDLPRDARADLCIRAGFLAFRHIAETFDVAFPRDPHWPQDPISIDPGDFAGALDRLASAGLPVVADREQAWRDFAGWRVNYDTVLLGLCRLAMAPPAPWSCDGTD